MASSTRDIRRRVKAVKNIRQITRAMELVAAAKMQRAVTARQQSRRYAELARDTIHAVTAQLQGLHHPLLAVRPRERLLFILISSNRGLAGGFNSKLFEAARNYLTELKREQSTLSIDAVSVNRKGRDWLLKMGQHIVADFTMSDRANTSEELLPLAKIIFQDYSSGKYDAVVIAYTDFVSMLRQEPKVHQLLPLLNGITNYQNDSAAEEDVAADLESEYLFEPNPSVVLESLIPRLLSAQLYQAVVESKASEETSRMMAMKNATSAAGDIIDDLTLTYNQLRQSGITQELAEISAGRLALGV